MSRDGKWRVALKKVSRDCRDNGDFPLKKKIPCRQDFDVESQDVVLVLNRISLPVVNRSSRLVEQFILCRYGESRYEVVVYVRQRRS